MNCWTLLNLILFVQTALKTPPPPKKKVSDFWSPFASPFLAFLFFKLWNDVQLQPNLEFCRAVFKITFSHKGMSICPIYEASLSHHTLYIWEIWSGSNNCVDMYHVFHWLAWIWSRPLTRNWKLFLFGLIILSHLYFFLFFCRHQRMPVYSMSEWSNLRQHAQFLRV